ncbi:uncharacterized protein [Drosophila bipectinata]|uniref:uncharacterized protein n=1 Tax=Drosophila bipectinata TaxID=42026 RepID=UPI001C8951B4|nr:uncharacterized protein LOC108133847 [Drosophila bipectinata]
MNTFMFAAFIMSMTLLEVSQAQRPGFAGLRPPGGLSQKDKYHATANTAVENFTGVDIGTRFGEGSSSQQPAIVNLDFGASQRPPMGVPIVLPSDGFVPDSALQAATMPAGVTNRFGTPDASATVPTWINLPVDAHGDREWVNHLSQLPVESQPFWFVNYQAIEAHRNSTRPNVGATETRGSSFRG